MLTIDEIKNVSFRKATLSGGYRAEDVDAFIDEVIASFEQLKKEKTNLVHKIYRLATRLEEYRADEETVRNALLTSQKMSDACIKEARDKAARIIRDAEQKAQNIAVDANNQTVSEKEYYLQLQADAVNLRAELIELYRSHIKTIDDLPTSEDLEKTRIELDEKYPTKPIESQQNIRPQDLAQENSNSQDYYPKEKASQNSFAEPVPAPSSGQTTQLPQQFMQTARRQQPQPITQQPVSQSVAPVDYEFSDDTKVVTKRQSKFAHLKFGDNYDVSAD